MSQVRIVTDSTADIPKDVREKLGIEMVPLKVLFGTESYRDAVDISADAFYDKLTGSNVMPTTSQPSPIEFLEVYQQLAEQGDGPIISIHLSSAMSGTYQSALIAKTMIDDKIDIDVVDSKSASYGFGLLVVAAAEAARQGRSREEILAMIAGFAKARKYIFWSIRWNFCKKADVSAKRLHWSARCSILSRSCPSATTAKCFPSIKYAARRKRWAALPRC